MGMSKIRGTLSGVPFWMVLLGIDGVPLFWEIHRSGKTDLHDWGKMMTKIPCTGSERCRNAGVDLPYG